MKRIPKIFKIIVAFCVCLALIRAANGAGKINIREILVDIQSFHFDTTKVEELVNLFQDGNLSAGFVGWNSELEGLTGFFQNIGNVLSSFFTMIWRLITTTVTALWSITVELFKLIGRIFTIALKITGIKK